MILLFSSFTAFIRVIREIRVIRGTCLLLFLFALSPSFAQSPPDLVKLADEVIADVSKIRELEVKAPIAKGVKSRDEIRAYLMDRIKEEYKPEEIELEGRVLKKLHLIPADMNLYDFVISLLTEQVAGYYDPKTKTFYIADWLDAASQKPIMAHELTHALQDQHFDVKPFLQRIKGNDDAMLARSAILEGDAVAVMIDYMLKPMGMSFVNLPNVTQLTGLDQALTSGEYKIFASAPLYFKETLIFPYTSGLAFLQAFRKENSWERVGQVYADLPKSTEQIMHPAKYMASRDDPTAIPPELPAPLKTGAWTSRYTNVLGEFSTLLVLKQFLPAAESERAAAGWDGDLIQLFTNGEGREALWMRFVFDTDDDATEFFDAYKQLVGKKYPDAVAASEQPGEATSLAWTSGANRITLKHTGERVEVLEE